MNYYIKAITAWLTLTMEFILMDDNLRQITTCINYANFPNINPLWVSMETLNFSCECNESQGNSSRFSATRFVSMILDERSNPKQILVYSCLMEASSGTFWGFCRKFIPGRFSSETFSFPNFIGLKVFIINVNSIRQGRDLGPFLLDEMEFMAKVFSLSILFSLDSKSHLIKESAS